MLTRLFLATNCRTVGGFSRSGRKFSHLTLNSTITSSSTFSDLSRFFIRHHNYLLLNHRQCYRLPLKLNHQLKNIFHTTAHHNQLNRSWGRWPNFQHSKQNSVLSRSRTLNDDDGQIEIKLNNAKKLFPNSSTTFFATFFECSFCTSCSTFFT